MKNNPTLLKGEIGIESLTDRFKFGDGVSGWNELNYVYQNSATSANSGIGYKLLADAGPIDSYGTNPSYFVCSSTFLVQGFTYNYNAEDFGLLRFVFDSRKEPEMILIWDYCGMKINPNDFLILHKIENNQLYLKVVYNQIKEYTGVKLICLSSQQLDIFNCDISWFFYNNGRLDKLPDDFTVTKSTIGNLKTGNIFSEDVTISGFGTKRIKFANATKQRYITVHAWDNNVPETTMLRLNDVDINNADRKDVVLSGIANPLKDDDAVNYWTLKSYVSDQLAVLKAELTGEST